MADYEEDLSGPEDATSGALQARPLSPWGMFWHRRGLHFATREFEDEFMVAHLHSDECVSAAGHRCLRLD